jgi:hypothetical protein
LGEVVAISDEGVRGTPILYAEMVEELWNEIGDGRAAHGTGRLARR